MTKPIRVRFAPSPTGHLHIGGARTALFNYLFAKQHGGTFILRLEDTDVERSTQESEDMILEDMQWLGLTWDEGPGIGGPYGPYRQSERASIYEGKVMQLVEAGQAYFCFCSAEAVEAKRQAALEQGGQPKYDGTCRNVSLADAKKRIQNGEPHVIRFKTPQTGETVINDLIRGRVVFENSTLDDFVIVRSNGVPTYNFAAVVDDMTMKISHIIRGDDHLSNTPRQICMYQAFGQELPAFAHVPMILGSDKTRLSKRHGATSVGAYAGEGYVPEALCNYLALLGWSFDDKSTLFTMAELIEKFSLEKVSKNPAVFDPQKLIWMNGQYLRSISPEAYLKRSLAFLEQAGFSTASHSTEYINAALNIVRDKMKLLNEVPQQVEYFFKEPDINTLDEKAQKTLDAMKEKPELFKALHAKLTMIESFSVSGMEAKLKEFIDETQEKFGTLAHPLRVCLTGRMQSPGIFEIMEILGKEKVLSRMTVGMKKAGI